ncbi:UDP-N-acetylmuramate--L-alanine ligase [Quadrisphaera granulorum]|uniref:UDP-N-acetylmuramate--L-alanine ligase n=1 Tax=Quadrisphaera granulorum TaxID=317664 RepID=A0A316A7H9_9ACTN|nr:UDP-N-acetylmuramate--L-alanine ligase [Quadrisphaera granulorum]PWJ53675.1 UDP-N-acetylmuramate--L-alanine ligase [Quadrisphaera granulorum]SZE96719.1 UDP-N-acetylmuramate--L-alanine ligase [Quadrisphaera granulorum]
MSARFDLAAPVPPLAELGAVHFIGIGGVGVSGVARIMIERGVTVSGSDAKDLPVMDALRALGARVAAGFDPARLDGVDTVVAGSAIREDNPELAAARAAGLRVLHRSQGLAALMTGLRGVAVAGTNGKTTTTAMLVAALEHAGADPSFAVGGELIGAGTNARHGSGDVFVAEADESDSSFLVYAPEVSVVTNVQPDHLDHHGSYEGVQAAFAAFAARIQPGGVLVACADDPGSAALASSVRATAVRSQDDDGDGPASSAVRRVVTFGEAPDAEVRITDSHTTGGGITVDLTAVPGAAGPLAPQGWSGRLRLAVPGWHNALDAAAAWSAAVALGTDPAVARDGLEAFRGTRRRFEPRGEADGVRVYDDYAHNPAKVAAAVATGRLVAGAGRLVVAFQPHLYSRTADFAAEFARALSGADEVVVLDVYAAREDPVPGVTGALVADLVQAPARVRFEPDMAAVAQTLVDLAQPGDLVLTIGAGDVTAVAGEVLALLQGRSQASTALAEAPA